MYTGVSYVTIYLISKAMDLSLAYLHGLYSQVAMHAWPFSYSLLWVILFPCLIFCAHFIYTIHAYIASYL